MKITRHLHYFQNPTTCIKHEFRFDPPIDIDSTIGKIDEVFKGFNLVGKLTAAKVALIINRNGILDIRDVVMKPGESLSIEVPINHRLDSVTKDDSCQMQILVNDKSITYWFTIGMPGAVKITGRLIKDDDNFHGKLRTDLTDTAFRDYLVKRTLADINVVEKIAEKIPDLMNTKEAAKYLGQSTSWLYKEAESGTIPRTKNKKFLKSDLDKYLK